MRLLCLRYIGGVAAAAAAAIMEVQRSQITIVCGLKSFAFQFKWRKEKKEEEIDVLLDVCCSGQRLRPSGRVWWT